MSNIICFLTVKPTKLFYNFCCKLKTDNYDIYICIDKNIYNIPNYDNEIKIIKIDNDKCEKEGYKSTVKTFENKCCSRDKALYYFNKNNIDYKYIWFIEEDVFIPSINTIQLIDEKYPNYDLLSASNTIFNEKEYDWHWNYIYKQINFDPPYARSMICAIRVSKNIMNSINEYVKLNNNLFLDEILFNTLALQNNLTIETPNELSTILFEKDWKSNQILETNLYHPIKNIKKQYFFRKTLNEKNNPPIIVEKDLTYNLKIIKKTTIKKIKNSKIESNKDNEKKEKKYLKINKRCIKGYLKKNNITIENTEKIIEPKIYFNYNLKKLGCIYKNHSTDNINYDNIINDNEKYKNPYSLGYITYNLKISPIQVKSKYTLPTNNENITKFNDNEDNKKNPYSVGYITYNKRIFQTFKKNNKIEKNNDNIKEIEQKINEDILNDNNIETNICIEKLNDMNNNNETEKKNPYSKGYITYNIRLLQTQIKNKKTQINEQQNGNIINELKNDNNEKENKNKNPYSVGYITYNKRLLK